MKDVVYCCSSHINFSRLKEFEQLQVSATHDHQEYMIEFQWVCQVEKFGENSQRQTPEFFKITRFLTQKLVVLLLTEYIEKMPIAALTGLMIMVAIGTFEWASIRAIGKMPNRDNLVGFLVAAITVLLHNLALAVCGCPHLI